MRAGSELDHDIAADVSFELEQLDELVAELVAAHAERAARDARIVALRLGLGGVRPETLTRIGARYDLARDRVRQLYAKAVGRLVREAAQTGHRSAAVFAHRYPRESGDLRLVRQLLTETYATDTDLVAMEWSYLKLRLAGHEQGDAKRVAGYVMQRILGWQKKTASILAKLHPLAEPGDLGPLLDTVDWPADRPPAPLPTVSARVADADDDGRGRFYLATVGRDVAYDSALAARLLRGLDTSDAVTAFQEEPTALTYRFGDQDQVHYPAVAAQLTDGRIVLVDVVPLGRIAFHHNRIHTELGRAHAHANGWGWLTWTGSALDPAAVAARRIEPTVEQRLTADLARGPYDLRGLEAVRAETGLELLDLAGLVLRNDWCWDRAPMRLSASPARPPAP
ncbi:sigma factor-like helix-turn-helix DNA-binding protein [Nocardia rhizosphaerae]|uniref:Sigma factor-like helix-turn-helix DNA-binding protein n=1 Tax=Nocardia rhizosphaerae TaxID=1691571 RepID=A0ABV8L7P6_9NOCA